MNLQKDFEAAFGRPPEGVWAAPGRVNLIGEHTDYNDGFMLPLAIPQGVVALVGFNASGEIRMVSTRHEGMVEASIEFLRPGSVNGWAAYVAGVVWALRSAGHDVGGVDVLIHGDVPSGAGLSSSAAIECSVALALTDMFSLSIDRLTLARLCQKAENEFVGMPSGILDQASSLLCIEDHVMLLDARSLVTSPVPLRLVENSLALLVIDTRAPHRLVDTEYAERRAACERAASLLGVPALREITPGTLSDALARLEDPVLRKRVRHVVTENARVLDTVQRLRAGSARDIGGLLTDSHASLRDDYEVTVPELDVAVEAALAAGAHGARMTGGGFGGSVIALVEADDTETVAEKVAESFSAKGFTAPAPFVVHPAPGARRLG